MKVATWNVNGIRARHEQVRDFLLQEQPDVLCLQEIKALPAQVPATLLNLEEYQSFWHGAKGGYSGVALLVRKAFSADAPVFTHPPFDHESRIVTALVGDVTIASVYVPNGGKDFPAKLRFLQAMDDFAQAFQESGDTLLLCGDINVAHTDRDVHLKERRDVIGQLPVERALIDSLLSRGMVDVGRTIDPENDGLFTWWAPWRDMRKRNIGWRLDYLYASTGLADRCTGCTVLREVGTSDHGPVVATFRP